MRLMKVRFSSLGVVGRENVKAGSESIFKDEEVSFRGQVGEVQLSLTRYPGVAASTVSCRMV